MERSSSACSAASSGERFACVSGGAASANGPKAESNVSTQRKGIKRLRIDLFKGCLTRNYTGPRNTQCTPPHSGAQSAARWRVAVRTTLLRRSHSAERCTAAKNARPRRIELPGPKKSVISPSYRPYQPQAGVFGGQPFGGTGTLVPPPRVSAMGSPTAATPSTIPIVHQVPRCGPSPCTPNCPASVSLLVATSRSSVAWVGGRGPELSPLRTLVICPAFTSTQTPARLQTFTNPSKVTTFIVPVVLSNATKKSVPTTPATPAGVRTSNFPSGLAIFCACVRSFP